ncbi:hypothetical protein B0T20DRAFT_453840 [Sordaria brevicollis]|uniref:Uncharacterized protein n=1 Tax=Sordaria brevicollis TaxID=83679 RepID=A0AAE0PD74_SORBR|nr:hypothetical protein B0T20DRAFT_453840 [Sordaria brevicollis]
MANTNPTMPKVSNLPPVPAGARSGFLSPTKEEMLADLRRQLDDTNSDGSSVDSRGRRRRRNKGALQKQGGLAGPQILPRLADTKPVRLQLGLNLDVEVELKARLQGDVSLTLLVEKKQQSRSSTQLHLNPSTRSVTTVDELFHLRLGTLRLRQRWLDRDVSPNGVGCGSCRHLCHDGSGMDDGSGDDDVRDTSGYGLDGFGNDDDFVVVCLYPTSAWVDDIGF